MIPDIEKFLPVAIFKMAATIPHKFNIVRFQHPELIPDIEKFLPVAIFKMAVTSIFLHLVIPSFMVLGALVPENQLWMPT
jgi:hypothetical protein